MRVLCFSGSRQSPSARFRVWQFVDALKAEGHEVRIRIVFPERQWHSRFLILNRFATALRIITALWHMRDAKWFDVVLVHRDIVPETRVMFLERFLAFLNRSVIFDFDDAIYLGRREGKLRNILPHFAWIMAGNPNLLSFARQVNPVASMIPTVVDTAIYVPRKIREEGPIRIGWTGSKSTREKHLPLLKEIMIEIASRYEIEFVVIADKDPRLDWKGVPVQFIRWTPAEELRGLQLMDIGLMPLVDELHERGKCGLKAITYMAVGIPAVVSPVGANASIVVNGVTGFHCGSSEEWIHVLSLLIEDRHRRETLGRAGRKHVEASYSINAVLPQILEIFYMVRKRSGNGSCLHSDV